MTSGMRSRVGSQTHAMTRKAILVTYILKVLGSNLGRDEKKLFEGL
jgi:hypothetical protein